MDKKVSVSFCLPGLRAGPCWGRPQELITLAQPMASECQARARGSGSAPTRSRHGEPHSAEREAAKHPARAGRGRPPAPAPRGGRREGRRPRRLSPGAAGKMFQGAVHEGNWRARVWALQLRSHH